MPLRRPLRYAIVGAGLVASWATLLAGAWPLVFAIFELFSGVLGATAMELVMVAVAWWLELSSVALLGATFAAPFGMLVRTWARVRMRPGYDMLAGLRALVGARPRWFRAVTWAPAAATVAIGRHFVLFPSRGQWFLDILMVALAIPPAFAFTALVRRYLTLLASPPDRLGGTPQEIAPDDEIFFSAVAVTREARAIVLGWALVTAGVLAALWVMPFFGQADHGIPIVLGYAALAAATAAAYRRASGIAVGLDGVLIRGTSRRRFFAYRDLEGVEITRSSDIVLRAGGREVLRLQLHGGDALRLESIVDRIRAGIERATTDAGHSDQRFAETASAAALAKAAHGQADYRARAASREDLLALIESPATAPAARAAAARALGHAADVAEHRRLRIAADRCADPEARAALRHVAAAREAAAEEEAIAAEGSGGRESAKG